MKSLKDSDNLRRKQFHRLADDHLDLDLEQLRRCTYEPSYETLATTKTAPSSTKHHATHHHRTHGTHPTKEPAETDSFSFKYDPLKHLMVAMTHHKCYIYTVMGTESTDVHTSHGLHLLETKLITMVDDSSMTYSSMSHDEVTAASKLFARSCNKSGMTTFKLN
ncbi:unnamed protein product [Mytilus coruscus]|uniref:Uncharacterized protein n=1 Tax=Mytilus coruscus TaxID=42192 RepID=A0A6J8B697_MYTCO|nr:unnamed protein product [Mytilus coruscus]